MGTRKHVFQLLSSVGDGTGTTDGIGDYSSSALSLKYAPTDTEKVSISRMIIKVQDTGTFDTADYGNGITLTNGIRVYVRNSADEVLEEAVSRGFGYFTELE